MYLPRSRSLRAENISGPSRKASDSSLWKPTHTSLPKEEKKVESGSGNKLVSARAVAPDTSRFTPFIGEKSSLSDSETEFGWYFPGIVPGEAPSDKVVKSSERLARLPQEPPKSPTVSKNHQSKHSQEKTTKKQKLGTQ